MNQEKPEMTTDEAIDLLRKGADRMARKAYMTPKEEKPEEKHAFWTWDEERRMYACSECGENPTDGTGIKLRLITLVNYYNFCRNCGAHMITDIIRQEQEEEA